MGFFKETTDKQATDWATQFRRAMAAKSLLKVTTMVNSVSHFRNLRKSHSPEVITRVLNWYCENAGKEYVPVAKTPMEFNKKFLDIQKAMNRTTEADDITPGNRSLADQYVKQYNWPVEVAGSMAAIVQRTSDNWDLFRVKMKSYNGQSHRRQFLNRVLETHGTQFMDEWIRLLCHSVGWMSQYSGSVMELAFRPSSDRFKASMWRQWSVEWCSSPTVFDSLLQELLEVKD